MMPTVRQIKDYKTNETNLQGTAVETYNMMKITKQKMYEQR